MSAVLPPAGALPPAPTDCRLLALGTSTSTCSVALLSRAAGNVQVDRLDAEPGAGKSGLILRQVDQLLAARRMRPADLDAIAFDAGPGAFTGLRIGCGVAQGLGFALNKPLVPVGSMDAIDLSWRTTRPLRLIAIDARMDELYCACAASGSHADAEADPATAAASWQSAQVRVLSAQQAILFFESAIAEMATPSAAIVALGNGFAISPQLADWAAAAGIESDPSVWPDAGRIATVAHEVWRLGRAIAPEQAAPLYVRNKVALDSAEQARNRLARTANSPVARA